MKTNFINELYKVNVVSNVVMISYNGDDLSNYHGIFDNVVFNTTNKKDNGPIGKEPVDIVLLVALIFVSKFNRRKNINIRH